jgi:hypothetical protein
MGNTIIEKHYPSTIMKLQNEKIVIQKFDSYFLEHPLLSPFLTHESLCLSYPFPLSKFHFPFF